MQITHTPIYKSYLLTLMNRFHVTVNMQHVTNVKVSTYHCESTAVGQRKYPAYYCESIALWSMAYGSVNAQILWLLTNLI